MSASRLRWSVVPLSCGPRAASGARLCHKFCPQLVQIRLTRCLGRAGGLTSRLSSSMPSRTQTLPSIPDPADPQLLAYLNLKLHEIGQPGVALTGQEGLSTFVDHFLTL